MLLKWLFLLTKRLYKKLTFLFILLLIPVSVALISLSAEEDSGFVTVALALEDKNDAIAMDIAKELSEGSELVHFAICFEKNQAMEMINTGKADSVWLFPEDMVTDQPDQVIAGEVIREKILRTLDREVPHGTAVEIETMQEGDTLTKIKAVIYCEKASHKPIIIGKKGEAIKRIGSYARADIEKLLDTQVYLELWVKVREDWRNKGTALKELGYTKEM